MRPILFGKKATDYSTNGLGRVDCVSCIVTEERNGIYELEAEVIIGSENVDKLEMDSILVVRPSVGASLQAFRIYNISKPINGHFTVLAQHISYQLSYIPAMPFSVAASTNACAQTLTALKSNATETCPFTFQTDVTNVSSYTQTTPASIRQRLGGVEGSVLDMFGGEYEWDNYKVTLHKNRGKIEATATLAYGKNITDLTQEEYISSTVTGVCPFWKSNDENGKTVTLPEKVIESQYADAYAYRRTIALDLSSDFENEPTVAQLRNAASVYVNTAGLGIPRVSIDVSFVDLAGTEEYKDIAPLEQVKLCDMVNVYFDKLGISTTAKVVKTVYNVLTERYDSVEIGSIKTNLASTIYGQDGAIEAAENRAVFAISKANTEITSDIDALRDQINNATSWLTKSGGYVIAVRNDDGSWKELLFMDTNDTSTAKNVLRINENGIGFSSRGVNGPYTQAWTLDGRIVIGGTNVPSLTVYKSDGSVLFQIDSDGVEWNAIRSSMSKNGAFSTGDNSTSKLVLEYGQIKGYFSGTQYGTIQMADSWSGYLNDIGLSIQANAVGISGRLLTRAGNSGTYYVSLEDGYVVYNVEMTYTQYTFTHIDDYVDAEFGAHGTTYNGLLPTTITDWEVGIPTTYSVDSYRVRNGIVIAP